MQDKIVHIIGAGPAGLTAAIQLAKLGYDPIVYEQHSDVGSRFHGDYQGIENWTTKEDARFFLQKIGIDVNFMFAPFEQGTFWGPLLTPHNVKTKRPLFYLIERGAGLHSLDQGLKQQAIAAGVKIIWNKRLERLDAKNIIISSGPKAADVIAQGIVFETSHKDAYYGFLDDDIAPRGYAYLLVKNGRATFATCMFENFRDSKIYFNAALKALKNVVSIDIDNPSEFGGYGNFFLPSPRRQGNKLFVGESTGFQDALWGFGLRYAMSSGFFAAVSIVTGENYEALCNEYITPFLKTSLANRWLYAHLGNRGYQKLLRRLASSNDVLDILYKQHQYTFLKKFVYQIAKRSYHSRLIDKQCMHKDCDCVWCRCGRLHARQKQTAPAPAVKTLETV